MQFKLGTLGRKHDGHAMGLGSWADDIEAASFKHAQISSRRYNSKSQDMLSRLFLMQLAFVLQWMFACLHMAARYETP